MQEPTPTQEIPAAADLVPNVEAEPAAGARAPRPAPTQRRARLARPDHRRRRARGRHRRRRPRDRLRRRRRRRNDAAPAAATDGSAARAAPIGAVSGLDLARRRLRRSPRPPRRGGMRGEMGNAITITAIDGTKLALETENGWTRTIDATGATVTKDGATVALSTLKVGDRSSSARPATTTARTRSPRSR